MSITISPELADRRNSANVEHNPPSARRRQLPANASFALQVSILVFMLAASSAPTPLYAIYQSEWGFSPITVTVVFGIYAIAVLSALLVVGSLSDHVGRRPVLLAALALQVVAMAIFATADGLPALLIARIVQGLSAGAAVGALGAGLIDLHKVRGTIANGVGAVGGTAAGALGSSLFVQYLPEPTHFVYLVLLVVFVLEAIGVLLMAESSALKSGAMASLKPQFSLPDAARRPLLVAAPVVLAVWSLAGFYASLGPSLVRTLAGSHSVVLGGLALFALAGSAAVAVIAVRAAETREVLLRGTAALFVGVGLTLAGVSVGSVALFFAGTVVAGLGFGAGFQGALRTVLPFAAAHERAGLLSAIYVLSYLALGVPAVAAGFLVVHVGVIVAAREYAVAVMMLAGLALAASVAHRTPAAPGVRPAR